MKRRALLLGASALLLPAPAFAQGTRKLPRVAILLTGTPVSHGIYLDGFKAGLLEVGLIEGRDLQLDVRWLEGELARGPALLRDTVEKKADILVVMGIPLVLQARAVTRTVPIVATVMANPVESGAVASLARPGGNVTGITNVAADTIAKGVEMLVAISPRIKRVALLFDPAWPADGEYQKAFSTSTALFKLEPIRIPAKNRADIESLPAALAREKPDALIVSTNAVNNVFRQRVIAIASEARVLTLYPLREWAVAGGAVSYGSNNVDNARRSASYVQRILAGAKPADLPIEQSRFELTINLKAAKALGIAIPQSVLIRADEVIE